MLKQMPTWKKAVFGILAIALMFAIFLFGKVKAEGNNNSSPYDANIVGDWQISSIVGSGDNSEDFPDYRGMLGINIVDDAMMAFVRIQNSEQTMQAA